MSQKFGVLKSDSDHIIHLISKILKPTLYALDTGDHSGEFASNDCLGVEGLAEGLALSSPPKVDDQILCV